MSVDLGSARGRIVIDAGGVPRSLAAANGSILGFSRNALKLGAGLGGGYGIIQGIRSTISAASAFEQQFSALRAVTTASERDFAALRAQAIDLGKSTTFSATEVAEAQTELAKAGASVQDILGGGLQSALALAAAGEIDLATAGTLVANSLNQFNLDAKDAGRVADILASTANTTATDVSELAQAFAQGASAAKQVGLPIEDFTALLGAMAEQGVVGSDAGTSLKAALSSLVRPVGAAATAVKKYGLEFFDANGKVKGAAGIADELRSKLGRLNPQQRTAVLQAIAGRDGFRALAAAYDLGSAALTRNIAASQKSGTAAQTAATKQDNLRGDVEKLGGAIETLQIRAGGAVQGGLRDLTQGLTGLIDSAGNSQELADFGSDLLTLGSGAASAVASMRPLAETALQVAGAALQVTGAVAGLAGDFAGTAAGATTLQVALVGLVSAYGTVKVAALAAAAAERAAAIAGSIGAFASLATTVRSAGGAMALLGATFPALANPLAATALGVAVVAGGVTLLASGAFRGASAAETLAASVRNVQAAASGASAAVSGLTGAIDGVKNANLQATAAALEVERSQRAYNQAVADYGADSLQARTAENQLAQAQLASNRARRDQAAANRDLGASAVKAAVGSAELITEIRRGTTTTAGYVRLTSQFAQALGVAPTQARKFATTLSDIDKAGGNAGDRLNALRNFIRTAASQLDLGTKSGKQTKAVLDSLSNLDNAGIAHFGQVYNEALAKGLKPAQALKAALADVKPPKTVKLDAKDTATEKARNVVKATSGVKDKKFAITSDPSNALAGLSSVRSQLDAIRDKTVTVRIKPVHEKGSWTVQETIENLDRTGPRKTVDVTFKPHGTGAIEAAVKSFDLSKVVSQREALSRRLDAIDKAEQARQQANERKRLTASIAEAERQLAKAKTPDERNSATRSIADAKAALAEFRITSAVEAKRTAIGVRQGILDGIIQGIEASRSDVSSALSDVGARLGEAIDRGLQSKLAGLADGLKATLAEIANSADAQRVTAIGSEIDASRDARAARDAGRQRTDLTKGTTDAAALVARRQAALDRARTASERQAAQALLDQALADQATAATALADFEEDQRIAALEREKASLETGLQQRRDAAQTAYDDQVAAANAAAELQKATIARQLGDLDEQFRAGLIKRKQFNAQLAAITGDPALVADLERSGRELGLAFSSGLSRAIGTAESAAQAMARAIAKYLKLHSPAEAGPLAHDFRDSGRTLVRDFAAGALGQKGYLSRSMAGVAGAAALGSSQRAMAEQLALAGVGAGGGGDTYQITIPAERPVEDPRSTAFRMAWELRNSGRSPRVP